MSKLIFLAFYMSTTFLQKVDLSTAVQQSAVVDIDTSNVMVGFNPYISVLDKYNFSRYGIAELVPLIQIIATRFKKIHIKFSLNHFNESSEDFPMKSLLQSPLAIAEYNCRPATKNKIEVFLEIDHNDKTCNCNNNNFYQILHPILDLAEKANKACSETVSTILIDVNSKERYCKDVSCSIPEPNLKTLHTALKSKQKFIWGLSLDFNVYCNSKISDLIQNFNVGTLIVEFRTIQQYLNQNSVNCKFQNTNEINGKPILLIKKLMPSNYGFNLVGNMSTVVSTWKRILTFPSDMYFFSFAFDFYQYDSKYFHHFYFRDGWWYTLKDPSNVNTTDFVFKEKPIVAGELDFEANPANYKWLLRDQKFNEDTTAILSFDSDASEFISSNNFSFCRVVLETSAENLVSILGNKTKQDKNSTTCKNGRHIYSLPLGAFVELHINKIVQVEMYSITDTETKSKSGYTFPLNICGKFTENENASFPKEDFLNLLRFSKNEVIIFHFFDDKYSVKLETKQLLLERSVMFEKCREIVQRFRPQGVEIALVSLGYYMEQEFQSSVQAMQKYVKYVYGLSDWAEKRNIVVSIGLLQDRKLMLHSRVGYYTYNKQINVYTPKNKLALQLTQFHFPRLLTALTVDNFKNATNEFDKIVYVNTTQHIILSCIIAITITTLSLLVAFCMRKYYNRNPFTTTEIDEFVNGKQSSDNDILKSSYDKEKYEICKEKFTVESDILLGSGEFGAVFRGRIEVNSGELEVAVKMANPQKTKMQTRGLLYEIKVLAFIGRHRNIVELLGANTESLKNGNVYVFLELCHLGSLKKLFQDMRLPLSSPVNEANFGKNSSDNTYMNVGTENTKILDSELFNDLYRWSMHICNGMAFLAEKHVVHADLATRNVLLNLRREAKICDFGLSRRMYNYANYVKTKQEPLPWKWMAPEALRDMEFNEKTDIWAFGVTLWEIYSLGSTPYGGLSWDPNFLQLLGQGLRLSRPEYCEDEMYMWMQKCWLTIPEHRPHFTEILSIIQSSKYNTSSE